MIIDGHGTGMCTFHIFIVATLFKEVLSLSVLLCIELNIADKDA